jgi:hypothetical protein
MRSFLLTLMIAFGTGAGAQAIDERTADRQLFSPRGIQLAVSPSLSEFERRVMSEMVKEADRTGQTFRYYGSIAYSPSEGLQSESLQGAFNFHSTAAADRAAVTACDAARPRGSEACRIAAQILPRGYEPGRVQLSYDATNAFRSTYRRVRGEKAFAVSEQTGAWRMAEGEGAAATAVELCNQDARTMGGAADCTVPIAN